MKNEENSTLGCQPDRYAIIKYPLAGAWEASQCVKKKEDLQLKCEVFVLSLPDIVAVLGSEVTSKI